MENIAFNPETKNLLNTLSYLWKCPEETERHLQELKDSLFCTSSVRNLQDVQHYIILTINTISNRLNSNTSYDKKLKSLITEIIKALCDKTRIDNLNAFFTIYRFLIEEIYDIKENVLVSNKSEEYKLLVVQTVTSLMKALTWDLSEKLYKREYALRLSSMFYVMIMLAKQEQLRNLRMAAIECLMTMAKVDNNDTTDIEIRYQVSDVFIFFLPGILPRLSEIALEEEIRGHNVALLALRAWGRLTALGLQHYGAIDSAPDFERPSFSLNSESATSLPECKWKDKAEVDAYLQNKQRSPIWYKEVDSKLCTIMSSLKKLTHHSHSSVRLELMHSCLLLIEICSATIPMTVSKAIEVLIILSQDEEKEISHTSSTVVSAMSEKISLGICKSLMENLEENFYEAINVLPRVCNSLNENEQLSAINLLVGYLKLFGKTQLSQVLHSVTHLKRLIQTLIHFCELERDVTLYEEYMIQDLEMVIDRRTPWKNFRYCRNTTVQIKFETVCGLLAECEVLDMASDVLLELFMDDEGSRNEVTLVLNSMLSGLSGCNVNNNLHILRNIIHTYLDPDYWILPLDVTYNCMLPQVKNNVIQICLQLEGLSKIALVLKGDFKQFLFKTLYPILEYAGSGNHLIKTAGLATISNVSLACGYSNITDLINNNVDYFSYHVIRKIQRAEHNESVLNVLTVVIKYSNIEVLNSISEIIGGVLMQTCDKFFQERNANAYLRVFQMFIKSIMKWFNIEIIIEPIKSKLQRQMEHEHFQVSNLNTNDQNDPHWEKTAEEMYKEDLEEKREQELNDNLEPEFEEIKKQLPKHVQLTASLLERCLNFLPCKDRTRKLIVLEILNNGLEIVRDCEDTLLPLVHKIWSPLIDRFKEKDDSVIINHSFQLLVTLARLSKDFIRSRTTKDVLPQIRNILIDLSKASYLKDAGATYRYTQAYKLQIVVIQQLGRLIADLDLADCYINETVEVVFLYLNDKQPLPLQEAALHFFWDLARFDKDLVLGMLERRLSEEGMQAYSKNKQIVLQKIYEIS